MVYELWFGLKVITGSNTESLNSWREAQISVWVRRFTDSRTVLQTTCTKGTQGMTRTRARRYYPSLHFYDNSIHRKACNISVTLRCPQTLYGQRFMDTWWSCSEPGLLHHCVKCLHMRENYDFPSVKPGPSGQCFCAHCEQLWSPGLPDWDYTIVFCKEPWCQPYRTSDVTLNWLTGTRSSGKLSQDTRG